ncbi:MAG: alpha/beta hydrolase, partial [Gammaproteobacteria bacterium]|nr:alpha/beta hydrolase [Gammaproteobacteria bacterium]
HDVWLSDAFTDWNITEHLARIDVPLLAMQGREDRYGSLDQLDTIARQVPNSQRVLLDDCGHSIHRDQPEALLDAVLAMGARTV